MNLLIEIDGWAAAGSLLLAYGLLSAKRINAGSTYQLLNLAGAVGLAVNAVTHAAWPSACLNVVWLAIGLGALQLQRTRRPVVSIPGDSGAGGGSHVG